MCACALGAQWELGIYSHSGVENPLKTGESVSRYGNFHCVPGVLEWTPGFPYYLTVWGEAEPLRS